MEPGLVGPGPYRATRLWNEIIELFRAGMPLRKHRCRFKSYERCFKASEAVDCLHELLGSNQNFGPEVTRNQTVKLLRKFLKNHVIEDIKGRWGKEDFQDDGHLYSHDFPELQAVRSCRLWKLVGFPPSSPLKPYPKKPSCGKEVIKFPDWNEPKTGSSQEHIPVKSIAMNSEMWYKRHSIAIGEVPACKLVFRRELTQTNIEEIWKSMTLSRLQKVLGLDSLDEVLDTKLVNSKHIVQNVYNVNKQGIVTLEDKSKELPHWILSAMKCLANWPSCSDLKQPTYSGFERDVFKTIVDYFGQMKEPLLTFHFFDIFVSVLGLLQKHSKAVEALQISCLLLPPENRKRLQLLVRMMARISFNKDLPPLSESVRTRTLMVQAFSRCILCSKDEMDLDELLAAKLVSFLMDNHQEILSAPSNLKSSIEEHVVHLQRVQIKYAGADTDATFPPPSFCHQISTDEFEYQRATGSQEPLAALLEEIATNKEISVKDKKKKLKQFQKSYPEVYKVRFPTPETEAVLFPEKNKQKPPVLMWALKKPFQPFHRTRSFRM
ncbi:PREDICTED: DEP domain-containing protein 1B isoform X1 [Calidris pugnax]|uniref:DEP domain-containing protein 1B isoform X1 n=1 Tax=Calidris pugnax TaxID=198806 RepID=UPI00071DBF3B|nr:PREDICTED: DEP domain-containing protein 1B isoform X1 [Calidris pugnax]